jgi:YgiT-type zinc finger domain-containing protein
MKCRVCGGMMGFVTTNLPFKIRENTIVILRELPVLQCGNCGEYLLDDPVMKRVEEILEKVDTSAELEIVRYAA